jgi:xylan 1,4-beta-xylosidase
MRAASRLLGILLAASAPACAADAGTAAVFPVSIRVDASQARGPLKPIWSFFGADEPNYATMRDGSKLLAELGRVGPGPAYFRAHNLLTSGDGTPALKWGSTNVYTEDAHGNPVYDWTVLDGIFDAYLRSGIEPYVEIGFMPEALAVEPEPYRHHWSLANAHNELFTGWTHPPRDYAKWGELVYQWARHCVERYGRAEVARWYWEVWNEANIGYWKGTPEEFRKLHDYAVAGVRRALPGARVGGPDTAGDGGPFTRDFIEHCLRGTNYATGGVGTPLDFVSFHAKGSPSFVDGHVRMGISNQLRTIDAGFALVASYPELRRTPIVIGESDPDSCAACRGAQYGYRNTTLYSSYTAATLAREYDLADRRGVNLEGALTWAFEFEDQPYFAGFRTLATRGIDLPVLNVFRMLGRMDGQRVAVQSTAAVGLDSIIKDGVRGAPDVSALASLGPRSLSVLVWHYHDDDVPGPDAVVQIAVSHLPLANGRGRLTHYRIDESHSNAFTAWVRMGSPVSPTPGQKGELESSGKLALLGPPETVQVEGGSVTLALSLPRQAVSLLQLEWERSGGDPPAAAAVAAPSPIGEGMLAAGEASTGRP